jgi:hypothetical protein
LLSATRSRKKFASLILGGLFALSLPFAAACGNGAVEDEGMEQDPMMEEEDPMMEDPMEEDPMMEEELEGEG